MNLTEKKFWSKLRKEMPGVVDRIENCVGVGMPDVNGTYNGQDYWVELKCCSNTSKERDVYSFFEKTQPVWMKERLLQNALIFTIVEYPKKIFCYRMGLAGVSEKIEVSSNKACGEWIERQINGLRSTRI